MNKQQLFERRWGVMPKQWQAHRLTMLGVNAAAARLPAVGFFTGSETLTKSNPPFKTWCWFWKVPLFDISLDKENPLTFCALDGRLIRQVALLKASDEGSIPPPAEIIPGLDLSLLDFPWTYGNHDSAYRYGGWFMWTGNTWTFTLAERADIDEVCLHQMLHAEQCGSKSEAVIYRAVRMFGGFCWDEAAQALARSKDDIVVG